MSDTYYVIGEDTANGIADAIREKKGYAASKKIKVGDFASEIEGIEGLTIEELIDNSTVDGSIEIETELNGVVRSYALYRNDKLKSFIGDFITSVGEAALSYCHNLETISLKSCTSLGSNVISHNSNYNHKLKYIDLSSMTSLPNDFFENKKNLETIWIPAITTLGPRTFRYCNKISKINSDIEGMAIFPNLTNTSATSGYSYEMWDGGNLITYLKLPKLTYAAERSFCGMRNVEVIELNPNIASIAGASAFANNAKLSRMNSETPGEIYLPNITSIGSYAFSGDSSIVYFVAPKLTSINTGYVWNGCTSLEVADVGSVPSLQTGSFNNCTSLTTIILRKNNNSTIVPYSANCFSNVTISNITIVVPSTLKSAYEASEWVTVGGVTVAELTTSFEIDSTSLTCVEGESFSSWVASANNTISAQIIGNNVFNSDKTKYLSDGTKAIKPTDVVTDTTYTWESL